MKALYEDVEVEVAITDKGRALLAAIEAGLIRETDESFDITQFERFWQLYDGDRRAKTHTLGFFSVAAMAGIVGALVGGALSLLLTTFITPLLV